MQMPLDHGVVDISRYRDSFCHKPPCLPRVMIAIPGIADMVESILKAVGISVQLLFAARVIEAAFIDRVSERALEIVCPSLAIIDNASSFLKLPSSLASVSDLSFGWQ